MTSKIEQAGEKFLGKRCPSAAKAAVDFAAPKARLEAAPFQDVSDPVSFFPPIFFRLLFCLFGHLGDVYIEPGFRQQ